MPTRARNWLTPAAWVAAVAALLLLIFPLGFPNYDTIYALLWGRELGDGLDPDRGAALPPTPHPLAELFGLLASPLNGGAIDLTMVVAYISLGLVGYLVYRLGSLWFDRPIGAVAALIVLTRAPFLSNGLRAYVDLPYIVLVLGALVIETKRPRAGWPVLALLAAAGLLRPEAWLFSFAYLAYLLLWPGESRTHLEGEGGVPLEPADTQNGGLIRPPFAGARGTLPSHTAMLVVLALAGPVLWALYDWITTGSPTYSFTGTRETVEALGRHTGPVDLILYGPRALGEVLQWPGIVAALGGVMLGFAFLRRRSTLGIAAAVLSLGAFAVLATAGLAIIARYTMLAAAILTIFVALALLGWRLLEQGHPWRRAWQAFSAVVVLMFVVWAPNQWDLLSRVDTDLTNQGEIESDLSDLASSSAFEPPCLPISVPNHRAVPRLAFDLDVRPSRIVSSSEQRQPRRGYFLDPASPFVIHNFILDPNDPARLETSVPPNFHRVARNESWVLYRRC
ncbi:MAG TPA: hypothetical protein VLK89_07750 [Solirubrobacterales bacterium]|nr:hypothetical protein [Solirubrobacterales bacterium]